MNTTSRDFQVHQPIAGGDLRVPRRSKIAPCYAARAPSSWSGHRLPSTVTCASASAGSMRRSYSSGDLGAPDKLTFQVPNE